MFYHSYQGETMLSKQGRKTLTNIWVCAIHASKTTKTPIVQLQRHMSLSQNISTWRRCLTYPSTNAPCVGLGTQRTLSFTLIRGLVKATRDKKPFRFHILLLCSALSREQRMGPTSESRLQVNCAQHKGTKRELYISMTTHPDIWHMKPVLRDGAVFDFQAKQLVNTCFFAKAY